MRGEAECYVTIETESEPESAAAFKTINSYYADYLRYKAASSNIGLRRVALH